MPLMRLWSDLRQDTRYAWRRIAREKGFAVAAVLTLALAIGGNSAMFSLVNALFLQPLSIRAPQELVRIHTGESLASWPNVEDIARRNTVFSAVIGQGQTQLAMQADPIPVSIIAGLVSTNYFRALGTSPFAGRVFQPDTDDVRADVVVIGERFWRARFGADPTIIGRRITLDGRPYEVIGIMPRAFRGIAAAGFTRDLWIPVDPHGAHLGLASDRALTRFEVFGP